jgi:ABC-2 type transport system ATP-binding protein
MNLLETINIVKQYAKHKALDNVSISVKKGSVFGLLGPNGAGKTSLIRIINQITAPDSGKVLFDGETLSQKHISQIGYLPEERGLYKKMTVGEQALYLAQLKGLSRKDANVKLKQWFEKFEILPWWNKKVEELSKGMQQKVQFIVTILHEPALLIFDEPFSGFDPINAQMLKDEIINLKNNGATIIFSTHNMASVEEICDEIALINKSKKVLSGNIDEIKQKYKSNSYEIILKGNVDFIGISQRYQYKIIDKKTEGDLHKLKIKIIDDSISTNQLIQAILPFGNIIAFNEIIPSMNDIFIKVVENKEN